MAGVVRFNLKNPCSTDQTLIYIIYRYAGVKAKASTKHFISPSNWDKKIMRPKNNLATMANGQSSWKQFFDEAAKNMELAYSEILNETPGTLPDPKKVSARFTEKLNEGLNLPQPEVKAKETLYSFIDRMIRNEITYRNQKKAPATLKTYTSAKNALLAYDKLHKTTSDFSSITLDFYHSFNTFLTDKGLLVNSIGKHIQVLKTFMSEAVELGLTENREFQKKRFFVNRISTDSVALYEPELELFYEKDLSDKPSIEGVRDLFIFGCWTGLRFSDYSSIQPENFVDMETEPKLKMVTQKTKEPVLIHLNETCLSILEKYKGRTTNSLPRSISNQKFNDFIKIAAKEVGLTTKGRIFSDLNVSLDKLISSHTARRSFATNMYLRGMPIYLIMKITGHRTEKAFLTYIRMDKNHAAAQMKQYMAVTNKNLLKVA